MKRDSPALLLPNLSCLTFNPRPGEQSLGAALGEGAGEQSWGRVAEPKAGCRLPPARGRKALSEQLLVAFLALKEHLLTLPGQPGTGVVWELGSPLVCSSEQ